MSERWIDEPRAPREGEELDREALSSYLGQLFDGGGALEVSQFPSGFSNLTYAVRFAGRELVLRRPPLGAAIRSAHDMGREFRILSSLAPVYPKAPRPIAYCEDESVLGAPFYLMERVRGIILRGAMPEDMHPQPVTMQRVAESWIDTLVELHAVDYQACGLGDLGRPEGYVRRQIEGWTKRYLAARTGEVPAIDHTAGWLIDHLPTANPPTLIHNDFKYDNVVLDPADWSRVVAVLDWEMATVGDPLMDLGTSLGYWVDPDDPPVMHELRLSPTALPGNPGRSEVAAKYASKSGVGLDALVFYYVFGLFKIAVIVQQIYHRFRRGLTQDRRFAELHRAVATCGTAAEQAIAKDRIDRLFE